MKNTIGNVSVRLTVELGRTKMPIRDILNIGDKYLMEFEDCSSRGPFKFYINDILFGTCKLVVLGDEIGVKIEELY